MCIRDSPRTDWADATAKAEERYEQGVRESISRKSFGKGVKAAGTSKWQENAIKKGPARFSEGVALGVDNYEKGFAPYREVIARTVLPTRGPKGDPKNIQRVAAMAKALHDAKVSKVGG